MKKQLVFERSGLSDSGLRELYTQLLKPRLIEEKMLIYLRQGKISKWFSGYGQEAISVGCAAALDEDEYIMTMHRNLGVFTTRKVPLDRLFAQFQGKSEGFSSGRDRSFHFGSNAHHIAGMISHLGPQLGVACGAALAEKLDKTGKCALAFTGDGGASEGDFHEALNVASVWDLPVIFVVENNQWGLSTPSNQQFRCKQFIDKGIGYGMEAIQVDGNNILEVYHTVKRLKSELAVEPRPVLLECVTFRIRGHEEASGTKYYPDGLVDEWSQKDPIKNFETYLLSEKILSNEDVSELRSQFTEEVSKAFTIASGFSEIKADTKTEEGDVFAPHEPTLIQATGKGEEMRLIDAVVDALDVAMDAHPELILMGQDIADYGGVFKATEGLLDKYGSDRVRNTPLCESAILGAGLGLSLRGKKSMVEMQFADFVSSGFNQIVNNLAKIHYRWKQNADMVIRMPTGAGVGAGPFHSQSNEAWFFKTPGLKIFYPSNAQDAKGLLLAAFADPNPVMFFEHKFLYRSHKMEVPTGYYTSEVGKANLVAEGENLTIVTYGLGVHWATALLDDLPEGSLEIIDLRTLCPLDFETIKTSVVKTGRVIVLHEDTLTGGIAAEIASRIADECFEYLDAPVKRCASLDTPVPFASNLEQNFLANARLRKTVDDILEY